MKPHQPLPLSQLLLLDVPVGATVTAECPACGRTRFRVTNQDGTGYLYNCFRASCGYRGYLPLTNDRSLLVGDPIAPERQPRPFRMPMFTLCSSEEEYLYHRVGFWHHHVERSRVRVTEDGGFAFPIIGSNGEIKGHHVRWYNGRSPKAETFLEQGTKSSWYVEPHGDPRNGWDDAVVLVEDIPSAVRVAAYAPAIALLGTSLDLTELPIIGAKFKRVVIALDGDAFDAAVRLRNHLNGWVEWIDILFLGADFKDMEEAALVDLIQSEVLDEN